VIAKITGTVIELMPHSAIVETTSGVGYEVVPSDSGLSELTVGQPASFYIAENIKEDEYTLYGFATLDQRVCYYQLTSVNGVGPKAAMAILGKHTVDEVQTATITGDITLFSNVSGIGKKTAQRIILELKGKIVEAEAPVSANDDPAVLALKQLGFTTDDARKALKDVDAKLDTQDRIRLALKGLHS
jgi:Holliday junction DNA helicase RuvA